MAEEYKKHWSVLVGEWGIYLTGIIRSGDIGKRLSFVNETLWTHFHIGEQQLFKNTGWSKTCAGVDKFSAGLKISVLSYVDNIDMNTTTWNKTILKSRFDYFEITV